MWRAWGALGSPLLPVGNQDETAAPWGPGGWGSGAALAQAMLIGRSRAGTGVLGAKGPARKALVGSPVLSLPSVRIF